VVARGRRRTAQQQGVGQRLQVLGHGVQDVGQRLQGRGLHRLQRFDVQLAGDQPVAQLQHHHQHAGQALAMRRAGRLQDQVARGLQLVGQGRLALQYPARGARIGPIGRAIGRRDDALGVGALQRGHAQQQGGHGLGAVTAVQQGVAGRAVQHVQQGTTGAPGGAQQRLVHAVGGLRRHGQQHGEHDGGGHRHATPTPGGGEKRQEGATHQQQPQLDRVSAQQLHRQEQRQARWASLPRFGRGVSGIRAMMAPTLMLMAAVVPKAA